MIRAVLFDFDGLILDTEYPHFLSWQEVFAEYSCSLALETWVEHIGKGETNTTFSPYEMLETLRGSRLDREAIRMRRRKRFAELMATQQLLPGVESLLQEAREFGLKVGMVSSSHREWITDYLVRFGLTASFDAIFCGNEVRVPKPNPELYLMALSVLGLQSQQALTLEDSAHGVTAAKTAGLFCVAVPNQVTCLSCLDHADWVLGSLAEVTLPQLLQRAQPRSAETTAT